MLGLYAATVKGADILWTGAAADGNWNTPGNWTGGNVPDAAFEEVAVINNTGTAFINNVGTTPDAAGLILGQAAGETGTLQVLSGGSITLVDSSGVPDGRANIGIDGTGTLDVRRGGSFAATLIDVNAGSNILIGTDAGGGFASVTSTGGMFLNGTTTVKGPGHTFSAAGNVVLENNSTYIANIIATTQTSLSVGGITTLGGTFRPQFSNGFSPAAGNKWNIVDSTAIAGAFANLDTSAVPTPGPGTAYQLAQVSGGTHGRLLQLQLNRLIQLTVNTDTGAVSISSPSGTSINMDGYRIRSPGGQLSPTLWNSLQDQAVAGWQEATPSSATLSELNSNIGGSLSVGTASVNLGAPYTTPAFGTAPDIQFRYTSQTGETMDGIVQYTGNATANNLLLTVDPATGQAQLRNSSKMTLQLVGYSILSASGSLLSGNADWLSLDDQNIGSWLEANPTSNSLNEFFAGAGATTLNPGQSYNLGNPFNEVGGTKDLVLQFALANDLTPRLGTVQYGSISAGVPGDYNGNGTVDAADYVLWRNGGPLANDPTPGVQPADYAFWRSHFGNTSGSGSADLARASAVPEPASCLLVILAAGASCCVADRRRHGH